MTPAPLLSPLQRFRRAARSILLHPAFLVALAVWTYLLLTPDPLYGLQYRIHHRWQLFAAKCMHAAVYGGLTVLAGLLPFPRSVARPIRLVLLAVLAAHAIGTEVGQMVMDLGRHGQFTDVLIDWGGILGGVVIGWRWWRTAIWPTADQFPTTEKSNT